MGLFDFKHMADLEFDGKKKLMLISYNNVTNTADFVRRDLGWNTSSAPLARRKRQSNGVCPSDERFGPVSQQVKVTRSPDLD